MSKGAAIANAVAQGINGYFRGINYNIQTEREKKNDEYREEGRARERKEWAAKDQLETDLKDAAAPRATMTGTVTEGGGNKYLSADPAQAASMQATLAAEAEMKGEAAPTQQAGTGIVGGMARGNEITTAPVDVAKLNSPDARSERVAGALRKNGQIERAMTMEGTVMDAKAKQLGLTKAEYEFADFETNRRLEQVFRDSPTFGAGVAKVLTDTQIGGMAGRTFSDRVSADGKTVEIVTSGPDGAPQVFAQFPNNEQGKAQAMQKFMAAPLATRINWITESAKAEREAKAAADKAVLEDRKVSAQEKRADAAETTANATAQRLAAGDGAGNRPPPGYRWRPDGSQEAIPGGPADIKAGELGAKRTIQQKASVAQADRVIGMVDKALTQVNGLSAGAGGVIANKIPGTTARDLQSNLETVKSNLGFAELQAMRDASPTGGALGAIAVQELIALQSTVASLDQSQSPEQLQQNLNKIAQHYRKWKDTVQTSMGGESPPQAPGGAQGGGASSGAVPTVADPADAMKLPSGSLFKDAGGVLRRRP